MEDGFLQGLPLRVVCVLVLHCPADGDLLHGVSISSSIKQKEN